MQQEVLHTMMDALFTEIVRSDSVQRVAFTRSMSLSTAHSAIYLLPSLVRCRPSSARLLVSRGSVGQE